MNFFGTAPKKPSVSPVDSAKEWKRKLAKETRKLDRDIADLSGHEKKACQECKKLAKGNQLSSAKILAREIVNTRKAIERMYTAKAQINSVSMSLQTSISVMKLQGCMAKSAEVMGMMNKLVSIPEIAATMQELAREMERSGLVEEIMGETLESLDPEGIEGEADAEVDRLVEEIVAGILAPAGKAPIGIRTAQRSTSSLSSREQRDAAQSDSSDQGTAEASVDLEEFSAMQARLGAL